MEMSLVYFRRGGIVVASQASDERSIADALKRFDPDLVLTWELDDQGRQVYEVHKVVGQDRPAVFICRWQDEYGEPLPLSHALLDLVAQLRRGGVEKAKQEQMRKEREATERDIYEEAKEIVRDMLPRVKGKRSSPLPRGVYLRRLRHRPGGRWYE